MTHVPEDALLSYALETIDDRSEKSAIASHLLACQDCSERLAGIRRDLSILGSLEPLGRNIDRSAVRRRFAPAIGMLQAAALLVIGFVLGAGAAHRAQRDAIWVAPAYVRVSLPPDSLQLLAMPDATQGPAAAGTMSR